MSHEFPAEGDCTNRESWKRFRMNAAWERNPAKCEATNESLGSRSTRWLFEWRSRAPAREAQPSVHEAASQAFCSASLDGSLIGARGRQRGKRSLHHTMLPINGHLIDRARRPVHCTFRTQLRSSFKPFAVFLHVERHVLNMSAGSSRDAAFSVCNRPSSTSSDIIRFAAATLQLERVQLETLPPIALIFRVEEV